MANKRPQVDRRKHDRCGVPTRSFVVLGHHGTILGQIIDISMGGLSFRYVDSIELPKKSHLDMHMSEHDLEIPNTVACKIVEGVPLSCRSMKRGGVKFGRLTSEQKAQLEYIVWGHLKERGTSRDDSIVHCQTAATD
jgi:hypothetical protein